MIGRQHRVALHIDQRPFALGMRAPQQEERRTLTCCDIANHRVSQHFPAAPGMTGGSAFFDSQASVQEKHILFRPLDEAAARIGKGRRRHAEIAFQFLKYIAQRGRQFDARRHRKRQSFGLPPPVVRVLPEDDDADFFWRRQIERTQWLRRKNYRSGVEPLLQKAQKPLPGRARKERVDERLPAGRNLPRRRVGTHQLIDWQPATHLNKSASASPGSFARMNASPTKKA